MKKIYKYSVNANHDDPEGIIRNFLDKRKIKYSCGLLLVFEISDTSPYFADVLSFMNDRTEFKPRVRIEYSKKELEEAKYLSIWLRRYSGYPQPEGAIDIKNSYINYTFDTSDFCTKCGSGLIQNDSFYLKKTFNIDKIRFGGVYWEYDTFFITNELRDLFIKEKFSGIEFFPVKSIKTKQVVNNIVQLKINSIFPSKLKYEIEKVINCKQCNQTRDVVKTNSELSAPKEIINQLDKDFYLSQEFHGDGLLCCKSVLISNRVYKFFVKEKIKNICAEPIQFI